MTLRVGIIGTGAIAHKHAQACLDIGVQVVACCDRDESKGRAFAAKFDCDFVPDFVNLCNRSDVDYVEVCTLPNFRLAPVEACALARKHVHVQKPIATSLTEAAQIIEVARKSGILLGVASQQRFTDGALFLKDAVQSGRLGKLIQADAYVKWYRSPQYYAPPGKGSWSLEGGGALINQAIHQVDLLGWLVGEFSEVFAYWQLGTLQPIESEDILSGLIRYEHGATGVIQASTALWPGFSEKIELHGTKGTAILTAGQLTTWSIQDEENAAPPLLQAASASGSSDPGAIDPMPFERQARNFVEAIESGSRPLVDGEAGFKTLSAVLAFYESCRTAKPVNPGKLIVHG